ncbi:Dolichyl-phosphate-mannose--protein mannosyltransferase 4 [Batrachochytrium dendrobatidis]|nr:Dolichyl-phosphate-mannose--protein mannosyltransferase 4 [Batrachochytrium dendrobatidis]
MTDIRHRKKGSVADPDESATSIGLFPTDKKPIGKAISSDLYLAVDQSGNELVSNFALFFVTALAVLTRTWMLHYPGEVVFDEVHFGKFASYYLRREYFFDVHPPLGKMLLAGVGYIVGYDGHFLFDHIGDNYAENNVPYLALRLWCALCGAAVVPISYMTLREIGVSVMGAALGALLLVFDNALITQSRLILLDSMLMLFCTMCIYFWVKFYKQRHNPFSRHWWGWLLTTGFGIALVCGVKMVGLFTMGAIGIATLFDLWEILDIDRGVTMRKVIKHFAARTLCLIIVPFGLYLLPFYIHFSILTKSGPGDAFMSMRFQEGLTNNNNTAGAIAVMYGANITLIHGSTNHYLHSHYHNYPLRYDDDRVSSQGQQVNAYAHSDVNSLWNMVPVDPDLYSLAKKYVPTKKEEERGIRYVRHNDIVRMYHVSTKAYLITHDVASPMTTTNMEMTVVRDAESERRYNETLWRVAIEDADPGDKLKSKKFLVKLINVIHNVALMTNKGALPDWGFKMQQTNGNKNIKDKSNIWRVDKVEHERIVNGTELGEETQKEKSGKPPLSFMAKFIELQVQMVAHNSKLTKPHPYSSPPSHWPFVVRGISFWEKKDGIRQIYLIGNPIVWWLSIASVLFYVILWVVDRICLRRGIDDFGHSARRWWDRAIGFLIIAWAMHWLPFFLMGRMLFLHHYLPAFIFSTMVFAAMFDFILRVAFSGSYIPIRSTSDGGDDKIIKSATKKQEKLTSIWFAQAATPGMVYYILALVIFCAFGYVFWDFSPFCYGSGFPSVEILRAHKWMTSWDLQYA